MGSVDGRLLTDRWTEPFNGKSKGELMGVYAGIGRRLNTDAWMFGMWEKTPGLHGGKASNCCRQKQCRTGWYG